MQILTIDDRSEPADIGDYFDQENEQVILTKDKEDEEPRLLCDVAHEVKQRAPDPEYEEKCVIFLNLFLECKDDDFNWQQDQAGIALLKFLRMEGVTHHVVLVTPYTFEELIKQDPGNYIISSEGVSLTSEYKRFIVDFTKYYNQSRLTKLSNKTFGGELKQYLKYGFSLPKDKRHNWANWWGIFRLWYIHTFVKEMEKNDIHVLGTRRYEDYPYSQNHFKDLRNRMAMYLFGHSEISLVNIFNQLSKIKSKVDNYEILSRWTEKVKEEGYDKVRNDYYDSMNRHDDLRTHVRNLIRLLNSNRARELPFKLFELRKVLQEIKPKILLVDDQAYKGWADIYQQMIYGSNQNKNPFIVLPDKEKNKKSINNDFYRKVINAIKGFSPDVILLDLRLKDETGMRISVDELSGAHLFNMIRENNDAICREVPVVITTASNKYWSYEELHRINKKAGKKQSKGVKKSSYLGYWIKEGLDVPLTDEESIANYIHFLELIIDALLPKPKNYN